MKIFTENRIDASALKLENKMPKNANRKKAKGQVEKKIISEEEIRQKLAGNVELSNSAKKGESAKFQQKLGDGFLNENKKPLLKPTDNNEPKSDDPNPPGHLLKSDVDMNDPNAEETSRKLKTVLDKGAFNFNSKERDVLERILSDR